MNRHSVMRYPAHSRVAGRQYAAATALFGACAAPAPARPPVAGAVPEAVWRIRPPDTHAFDPSGITRIGTQLLIVSDKVHYGDVYALVEVDGAEMEARVWRAVPNPPNDAEGIAACGGDLAIVDEASADLWLLHPDGTSTRRTLGAFDGLLPQWTWANAGLEGVACAPDGRAWVAKEREPRAIAEIDLRGSAKPRVWPVADEGPTMHDGTPVSPSWSDLSFADGHLYALHRDAHSVVRLDPQSQMVTATFTFQFDEPRIYDTDEPYGMAEGLLVDPHHIWILLDNNGATLRDGSGNHPLLLRFSRPSDF